MDNITSDTIFAVAIIATIVIWHWINKKYGDENEKFNSSTND
ncbi:gp122 (endogenous virus) [Lactococcus phage KSY1]|uniref:Gp122 n=1 Tax=Lactococcus phage KSY1 TaxID=2913972 RepID=A6MAI7_9CAUD|nr:gp122 [Lactococcus phage KSY1]ABG21665.1 gp122 [Lactococcus phage KSY1]